jgi:hypothetical protein
MPTTTPSFGWPVPVSSDLVKNGATAIESLGDAIDASLVDLKGGTTGQVLAKASGTDMDFSWVAQDDSNAIQNAIVDAKGDLIAASAADTPARLAVGTNGQILTADSSAATGLAWATPSSGSGLTKITSATFTTASALNVDNCFSSTYRNYLILVNFTGGSSPSTVDIYYKNRVSSTNSSVDYSWGSTNAPSSGAALANNAGSGVTTGFKVISTNQYNGFLAMEVGRPFAAASTYLNFSSVNSGGSSLVGNGQHLPATSYDGFALIWASNTYNGEVVVYGYSN